MAEKKLLSLFNRCNFDDNEKTLFESAVVTRVAANTEYRKLKVDIIFYDYVNFIAFSNFVNKVKTCYNLTLFDAQFKFCGIDFCEDYWSDIVAFAKLENSAVNGFLNDCTINIKDKTTSNSAPPPNTII